MDLVWTDLRADETTTLNQFLDFYRAVVYRKLNGLTAEQAHSPALPPSTLTIGGIVKHLALVEDTWVQETLHGRELPEPWQSAPFDDDPDWDFHSAPNDSPEELLDLYTQACARSRDAAAGLSLEHEAVGTLKGEPFSLRRIIVHMIEEVARHAGHADLLREALDGVVGD